MKYTYNYQKTSYAIFQLFHYYSGRAGGRLCKMKIRLTQPSLAGTWAELGNRKWNNGKFVNSLILPYISQNFCQLLRGSILCVRVLCVSIIMLEFFWFFKVMLEKNTEISAHTKPCLCYNWYFYSRCRVWDTMSDFKLWFYNFDQTFLPVCHGLPVDIIQLPFQALNNIKVKLILKKVCLS